MELLVILVSLVTIVVWCVGGYVLLVVAPKIVKDMFVKTDTEFEKPWK